MKTFFNLEINGKTPAKFIWKHFLFTFLWTVAILTLIFRIDVIVLNNFNIAIDWLEEILPMVIFILIATVMVTQKWYYNLVFFLYPILAIGCFIPKIILSKGKIYLFLKYLTFILNIIRNIRRTVIHFGLFAFSCIILFIFPNPWSSWFAVITFTYFYFTFLFQYIKQSLSTSTLFGFNIATFLDDLSEGSKENESILVTSIILKNDKDISSVDEIKTRNLKRLIFLYSVLDSINSRLNFFRGKRAFGILLIYEFFLFLLISIFFFWFVNYEIFQIDSTNYQTVGTPSRFEFLYYTFKTLTFSGTDTIKPFSWIAKSIEIFTYLVVTVLFFVVIVSVIFSFRNEIINENIKLTKTICQDQSKIVKEYIGTTYEKDIQTVAIEIANIEESMKQLRDIINKLF